MSLLKSSKSLSVALGVSVCGLGGYLLYNYLKTDHDNVTIKMVIPSAYVGYIIGRRGCRVKELEYQSGATIKFNEDRHLQKQGEEKEVTCIITGSKEACTLAEYMINIIINEESASLCEQINIPESAIGSLIGYDGSTIKAICNATGSEVNVGKESGENKLRRITLKGTREQIDATKDCIQSIVDESQELVASMAKRAPRSKSKFRVEKLAASVGSSSPFEVYVSAMIDPSRFWLQIVGPKAQELDLLVEEMTEYYKVPENRAWHMLNSIEEGDLVAATFQYDERWYRAEVLELNQEHDIAELYYVDYGDTEKVATADLYELKVNYLQLHFQAIECFLSRIEPVDGVWTSEAVDRFEEWAHVAHWRKLSAKLTNYSTRQRSRAQRGSSPVPGVELFDVVNDQDINIGEELVRQGYATYKRASSSSRSSSTEWETLYPPHPR